MWGEKGKTIIKPKGQGRGIMVSDFIEERNGFLALSDSEYQQGKLIYRDVQQQTRTLLKYYAEFEGYWNNETFLKQMEAATKIAKVKYSSSKYNVIWFFDHSSCRACCICRRCIECQSHEYKTRRKAASDA